MEGQPRDEEQAVVTNAQTASATESPPHTQQNEKTYLARRNPGNRLKQHLNANVDPKWADTILITCFYVSGLVDSVAFNVWACFASMQTGNTIFVGLGVSNQPFNAAPYGWAKSLIAIICFIVGAFAFANFHRFAGPLRRSTLIISFSIQTGMIMIAAILATVGVVSGNVENNRIAVDDGKYYRVQLSAINWKELAPLAFLAFQSSGQIVASRMLQYNELPTVVLTSLFCDLMSDPALLTASFTHNAKRNRRAIAAIFLFVGALSGGYLTNNWVGVPGALWLATFLKACMILCWIFWWTAPKKSATALAA